MPLVHDLAKSGTTDWSGGHLALIVAIAIHLSVIESTSERKKNIAHLITTRHDYVNTYFFFVKHAEDQTKHHIVVVHKNGCY